MDFFKYINLAIRNISAKGHRNGLKILTLGVGLAAVLVLSAKVCLEGTFDTSFDDADRIYYVTEAAELNGSYQVIPYTSGGIAPALDDYFPQIECATRFCRNDGKIVLEDETERISYDDMALVDTSFFKVLTTECIAGDITTAMSVKDNAAVSLSMARKLYRGSSTNDKAIAADVIGKSIRRSWDTDQRLIITGVFADYPVNSSFRPDIVVSLKSIGHFWGRDCSSDLVGSDNFVSLVKLAEGVDAEEVVGRMDQFREDCLPVADMREFGLMIDYMIHPFADYYACVRSGSYSLVLVLLFVAMALLLTSVLNYMLNVISSVVTRSREMALRKCLGSMKSDVYMMLFAESLVHTFLALALAAMLISLFGSYVVDICGCTLPELFSGKAMFVVAALVSFVLVLNTVIPGEVFSRVPVASAFRNYRESKRRWKKALLAVEFASVSFLGVMAVVIALQYNKMVNSDMGFRCDDVVLVDMTDAPVDKRPVVVEELRRLPEVAAACAAHQNPFYSYGGNNVFNPDNHTNLFNIKDGFYVEPSYFEVLDIPIVKGSNFTPGLAPNAEVIVDELFVEQTKKILGWDDVIGKQVSITSHNSNGMSTIVGVMRNIHNGSFSKDDELVTNRAVVFFTSEEYGWYDKAFARFNKMSEDSMQAMSNMLRDKFAEYGISITPFRDFSKMNCSETLKMRNAILVGCFISLLVAVLGLIGYTIDEIKLRQKEIAVRRVNGALVGEIRRMFVVDILRMAIPSVVVGCVISTFVSLRWQEQFTLQVGLPWWVFVVVIAFVVSLTVLVNVVYVYRYANENPAKSLKMM